jgi:ribosomal protein L31E
MDKLDFECIQEEMENFLASISVDLRGILNNKSDIYTAEQAVEALRYVIRKHKREHYPD